jgi:hypothetical protein
MFMKKYFLVLILAMTALTAYADIEGAPFLPEVDNRFDAIEQGRHLVTGKYPAGAADGNYVHAVAHATYDFAVKGGASTVFDLGVVIPKNAIIEKSYLWSVVKPTTSASGTLAWNCGAFPLFKTALAAASYASAGSGDRRHPNGFGCQHVGCKCKL